MKNGKQIWDVEFSRYYKSSFGFYAVTDSGEKYVLRLKGLFFWRKLLLLKNDVLIAHFKPRKCLLSNNIYLDGRNFIYETHDYICSLDPGHLDNTEKKVIYFWKTERQDLEWIIITLALLSKQSNKKTFVPYTAVD
jgi:hypothetical protein